MPNFAVKDKIRSYKLVTWTNGRWMQRYSWK